MAQYHLSRAKHPWEAVKEPAHTSSGSKQAQTLRFRPQCPTGRSQLRCHSTPAAERERCWWGAITGKGLVPFCPFGTALQNIEPFGSADWDCKRKLAHEKICFKSICDGHAILSQFLSAPLTRRGSRFALNGCINDALCMRHLLKTRSAPLYTMRLHEHLYMP